MIQEKYLRFDDQLAISFLINNQSFMTDISTEYMVSVKVLNSAINHECANDLSLKLMGSELEQVTSFIYGQLPTKSFEKEFYLPTKIILKENDIEDIKLHIKEKSGSANYQIEFLQP